MIASILGGTRFGVAKKTSLVSLKVTDDRFGGTTWSIVMAAVQWAYDDAKANNRIGKSVINMSLGGPKTADDGGALIDLVNKVVSQGLLIVVSAGNDHVSLICRHLTKAALATRDGGRR